MIQSKTLTLQPKCNVIIFQLRYWHSLISYSERLFGGFNINMAYIDGYCSVDHINCSLVIPVNRQRQSDSY